MPSPETLEKSISLPTALPQKRRWGWLVAPLMGISFVLHLGLLFLPLPAQELVNEELEEEELQEEPEILSLSTVEPPPEPIETSLQEQQPAQNEVPPPSGEPPPPRPEDISENTDELAIQEGDLDSNDLNNEAVSPAAFDPGRQQAVLGSAREYLDQSEFGGINSDPGLVGASISGGWPGYIDSGCFFDSFEPVIQPTINAADAMFFTRNLGLVRQEELPRLVQGELFQHGHYCDAEFYEVLEEGVPVLFLSLIGIGDGNPPGSAVAVFWESDPR
ncbi:MAG: hypothetical protein ACFB0C_13680 [Leptolyngbyaceae cyanobacterium]